MGAAVKEEKRRKMGRREGRVEQGIPKERAELSQQIKHHAVAKRLAAIPRERARERGSSGSFKGLKKGTLRAH